MNDRRFFCCLFTLLLLTSLLTAPVWATERRVQLTIPGCDS
jgi:hypothetical protein